MNFKSLRLVSLSLTQCSYKMLSLRLNKDPLQASIDNTKNFKLKLFTCLKRSGFKVWTCPMVVSLTGTGLAAFKYCCTILVPCWTMFTHGLSVKENRTKPVIYLELLGRATTTILINLHGPVVMYFMKKKSKICEMQ